MKKFTQWDLYGSLGPTHLKILIAISALQSLNYVSFKSQIPVTEILANFDVFE